MSPTPTAALIYLLGRRDVQLLIAPPPQGDLLAFEEQTMAVICRHLEHAAWDWGEAGEAREKGTVNLDALTTQSSLTLAFPFLERLLRRLRQEYPGLRLLRLILVNTDRQNAAPGRTAKFAAKEPYLFHAFIAAKLPEILTALGYDPGCLADAPLIIREELNLDRAFALADAWFQDQWPHLDSDSQCRLILNHGPGIPFLGRALSGLAGVYYPERVALYDQVEHGGARYSRVPLYEQAFKDRHGLLAHLDRLDLPGAWQVCAGSPFYQQYDYLAALLQAANEALGGDPEQTRQQFHRLRREKAAFARLLSITPEHWETFLQQVGHCQDHTQVGRTVVRLLNCLRRQDYLGAGFMLVTCVECAVRLLIRHAWPPAFTPQETIQPRHLPEAAAQLLDSRTKRRDGTYLPNFDLYARLLPVLCHDGRLGGHAQLLEKMVRCRSFSDLRRKRNDLAHRGHAFQRHILAGALYPHVNAGAAEPRLAAAGGADSPVLKGLTEVEADLTGWPFCDWTIPLADYAGRLIGRRRICAEDMP